MKNSNNQNEIILYFLPDQFEKFAKNTVFYPDKKQIHHIRRVLRKTGSIPVILTNGQGKAYSAVVDDENRAEITSSLSKKEKNGPGRHLLQAIIDRNKMEYIIRKAVEIGADSITFFYSFYSQRNFKPISQKRIFSIIESALIQSKNILLPEIAFHEGDLFSAVGKMQESLSNPGVFWGEWKEGDRHFLPFSENYLFINGPEGGWSKEEKVFLKKNFPYVRFSDNVLRSETAAVAGLFFAGFCHRKEL